MTEELPEDWPPFTLVGAAVLICAETAVEILAIGWRDNLRPALRVFLMLSVGLQFVFVHLALRRSAGAVLGLFLFQGTAVLAALAADVPLAARLALAAVALTSIGLLAASAHAFPTPELPRT